MIEIKIRSPKEKPKYLFRLNGEIQGRRVEVALLYSELEGIRSRVMDVLARFKKPTRAKERKAAA